MHLGGNDDHLYGDYVCWKRRFPWEKLLFVVFVTAVLLLIVACL